MLKINGEFFTKGDNPIFLLGINYLPAEVGHSDKMWSEPDFDEMERDFRHIHEIGINVVRLPYTRAVMPRLGEFNDVSLDTFDRMTQLGRKYDIYLLLNFYHVGHCEWFQGVSIFSEEALANEIKLIQHVIERYKDEPQVLAWDLFNEPNYSRFWYGEEQAVYPSHELSRSWCKRLCDAAREADPNHPVTIGVDHATIVMDVGFDSADVAEASDFVTTHFYSRNVMGYMNTERLNSLRDSYVGPFVLRFSQKAGKIGET